MIVNVITDSSLGCTDRKNTEIWRKAEEVSCRLWTPGFRIADCGLFGKLLGGGEEGDGIFSESSSRGAQKS